MTASEHQIAVVFDVTANIREGAAKYLAERLNTVWARLNVESWWFPEADLKPIDRNDNPAASLVSDALITRTIRLLEYVADHGGGERTCDSVNACPSCEAHRIVGALSAHEGWPQ